MYINLDNDDVDFSPLIIVFIKTIALYVFNTSSISGHTLIVLHLNLYFVKSQNKISTKIYSDYVVQTINNCYQSMKEFVADHTCVQSIIATWHVLMCVVDDDNTQVRKST